MKIDILMTTDENYILQTKVAIWSARKYTNSSVELCFTILCTRNLDVVSRKKISVLADISKKLTIHFYEVNEMDFSDANVKDYITVATYYKLIGASVLPESNKCIFLDSDLVVRADLCSLYNIDISDVYVAGVQEMVLITSPNFALDHQKKENLPPLSDYINSGVLLWNLELVRKEGIEKKLLKSIKKHYSWLEQDIIHDVCHDHIKLIDYNFNYNPMFLEEEYEWNYPMVKKKAEGRIIHYVGPKKAWKNTAPPMAHIWWNVAKEVLEKDEYDAMYQMAECIYNLRTIKEISEQCNKVSKVFIAGYSNNAMVIKQELRKNKVDKEIIFCDNNEEKQKLGIIENVISVKEAVERGENAVWINAVQNARKEITAQLMKFGIARNRIFECSMGRSAM